MFCSHCGKEITPRDPKEKPTTIEKTSKIWKKMQLKALGLIVGGIIIACFFLPLGIIIILVGLGMAVYAHYKIWWHHG